MMVEFILAVGLQMLYECTPVLTNFADFVADDEASLTSSDESAELNSEAGHYVWFRRSWQTKLMAHVFVKQIN